MSRGVCIFGDGFAVPVRNLSSFLAKEGWEVHVFSFSATAPPDKVNAHVLPVGRRAGLIRIRSVVLDIAREFNPDVVHSFYLTSYGFGVCGLAGTETPVLSSAMGSDVFGAPELSRLMTPVRAWMAKKAITGADLIHSVAEHVTDRLVEWGAPPSRIRTFPRGVSLAKFPAVTGNAEVSEPVKLLCNRRLEPLYDHRTLIDSLRFFLDQDPGVQLRIVGDGYLRSDLEKQAKTIGVDKAITFEPEVPHDQVPGILSESQVFVTSSLTDGTSSCLLEAMASGCIPLATDIPANRPWIQNGVNGYLFRPGDSIALADAIRRAIWDRDRWPEIRRVNRERVERDGSLDAGHQKVLDMYEELLEGQISR